MKSFFKKLAFVMALAMVVSMVAPAGSALAAETGVSLQGTKTIVETYELEKGATVDFSFQGAPKDWKSTFKWTSSNEAVATVTPAGVVTAVAAGTATIKITAGADASYAETVVVTVKAPAAADAFEVKQVSTTAINLVFATKQDVKAEDLEFSMKFGDVYAVLPIKDVKVNENVATVTVGDNHLIDGETYNFKFGNQSVDFVASIGDIESVAYTYFTDYYGDGAAYVSTEEKPSLVTLVPVFYDANGIDVSAKYVEVEDGIVNITGDLNVEYEIVNEDYDAYDFDVNGTIEFLKAAPAAVKILVSWTNIDGEETVKPYSGVIVGAERAPLTVKVTKAGFYVPGWFYDQAALRAFQTNSESSPWSKAQTSWNMSDATDLYFAAALSDNRGTKRLATGSNYEYGTFEFESSNTEIFDIDSDSGLLSFYKAGTASVLVYFVDLEGNRVLAGAQKLTFYPERYVATYEVDASTTVALGSKNHTGNVTLTAYDQYGQAIKLSDVTDITVEALYNNTPVEEIENIVECTQNWCGSDKGHYHITFDADDYAVDVDDNAYKTYRYRVTVDKDANDTLTTGSKNVSVKVMNVKEYADSLYAFWDGEAAAPAKLYYGVGGGASVDLRVDISEDYSWTGLGNAKEKTIGEITAYTNNGLNLGKLPTKFILPKNGVEAKDAQVGYVYYEITAPKKAVTASGSALYNSFNNWNVNGATTSTADEAIVLATSTNGLKFTFNNKNWVKDADLTAITPEENWNEGADGVYVANLAYATTGTYTVNYYYVKSAESTSFSKLGSASINVTNSQPGVTFVGFADEDSTTRGIYLEDVKNDNNEVVHAATTADDVATIIKETLKFKYDGATLDEVSDWDRWTTGENATFIEKGYKLIVDDSVNAAGKPMYQIVENGKLRVNWVKVKVKLEDWTNTYYEMTVNVGKTIKTAK